jgi:hypothetical protein
MLSLNTIDLLFIHRVKLFIALFGVLAVKVPFPLEKNCIFPYIKKKGPIRFG